MDLWSGEEDGGGEDVGMKDGGVGEDPGDHERGEGGHESLLYEFRHLILRLVVEVGTVHKDEERVDRDEGGDAEKSFQPCDMGEKEIFGRTIDGNATGHTSHCPTHSPSNPHVIPIRIAATCLPQ